MSASGSKTNDILHSHASDSKAGRVAKVVLPFCISLALVLWLFHKINVGHVEVVIHEGIEYRYIIAMMIITAFSMILRGIRWGLQLQAVGIPRLSTMVECVAIFGAYALNLVVPYLGEAWRCVFVSKRSNAKISTVIGTDIGDRTSDAIVILLLICLSLTVAYPAINNFFREYTPGMISNLTNQSTWIWIGAIVTGVAIICYISRNSTFIKTLVESLRRIWCGFVVLFHLPQINLYLILTIGIWTCYFLQTYVCFFAFPFTRDLLSASYAWGLLPGLIVFVFGSTTMIIPSNGGLGPWNIAVTFALTLYGVSKSDAVTFSIVCWSFQAITYIGLGLYSAAFIAITRRQDRITQATPSKPY